MFMPFRSDGTVDHGQAQMLAAFLMAINEINSRSDILPHYQLQVAFVNPESDDYVGGMKAAEMASKVTFRSGGTYFSHAGATGVDAVVGGLSNLATIGSNYYFSGETVKILQIHSFANATELGVGADFPYKVQTTPIESFQGMVLESVLCTYFQYSRISVFASNDIYGIKASTEVGDNTYCPLNFLSVSLFHHSLGVESLDDLNSVIDTAKAAGSNIFILFMPDDTAGRLLYQGWKRGLFKQGTQQIFGPVHEGVVNTLKSYAEGHENVIEQVMTGYLGIRYDPFYNLRNPTGKDFISKFKAFTASKNDTNGACNTDKDDTTGGNGGGVPFWSSGSLCAGEFKNFKSNGLDIYPYAPHAYDATYGLAFGLHALLEGPTCSKDFFYCNGLAGDCLPGNFSCMSYTTNTLTNQQGVDALMLHNQMVNAISYNGSTGYVHYYIGMTDIGFDDYARGDREQGHYFGVWNFNYDKYLAGHNDSFGFVGIWTVENSMQLCTSSDRYLHDIEYTCYNITYNTYNGLPALDKPSYMMQGCCSPTSAPKTSSSGYNVIKIGGYFTPLDQDGNFNEDQAQMQAAFIMAINEINQRSDILPTTKLVYTVKGGNGFYGAMTAAEWLAELSFGGFTIDGTYYGGVDAIVGAGNDMETMSSDQLLAELKVVQVHTVAMDTDLGIGQTYPYKIQVRY